MLMPLKPPCVADGFVRLTWIASEDEMEVMLMEVVWMLLELSYWM